MNVNIADIQQLNEVVKTMMAKCENLCKSGIGKRGLCTVCGKEGEPTSIINQIESNHLEGISLPCNSCDKMFRSRKTLRTHVQICNLDE